MTDIEEVKMTIEKRRDGYWAIVGDDEIGPRENGEDLILEVAMNIARGEMDIDPFSLTSIRIIGWSRLHHLFLSPFFRPDIKEKPTIFSETFQKEHL